MRAAVVAFLLVVAACPKPGVGGGGEDGFRVFYPDAGDRGLITTKGTRMQARPAANCLNSEGAEGRWANTGARVVDGELPPGLAIEDGAISGVPTATGTWKLAVLFTGVSCAALPVDDQRVDLSIVVR
jgi:hypothetical protein